jgi:hypothetical protein
MILAAEKKPDLAVRKMIVTRPVVSGRDVVVSVSIYNVGTAYTYIL